MKAIKQYNITYFFRRNGYSIERVFDTLIDHLLGQGHLTSKCYLPESRADLVSIFQNLHYVFFKRGEINHITGDIHYISLVLPHHKTILTIHDCIMIYRNTGMKRILFQLFWLKVPVFLSNHVTVISSKTKEDIIKFTRCNPDKISVIYNPVSLDFKYSPKEYLNIVPIILHFTGTEHKNTGRVLDALQDQQVRLIIVGTPLHSLENKILHYKGPLELYRNLSNAEILDLYTISDIVLFPSYFEGFGMPIIEGQATGRVVITSNIEPMIEVAGDGAHFVNPFDIESIREGILKVIHDEEYRNSLIIKGQKNVERFHVEKIAEEYLKIYNKINN